MDEQRKIVDELNAEQVLVDGNLELMAKLERKSHDVLARIWNGAATEATKETEAGQ